MKAKDLIWGFKKAINFPFFMDVYGHKTREGDAKLTGKGSGEGRVSVYMTCVLFLPFSAFIFFSHGLLLPSFPHSFFY